MRRHYEGRTAQEWPAGEKFDSSYDRGSPTTFAPNQVIAGWTEAMQLMVEGDETWESVRCAEGDDDGDDSLTLPPPTARYIPSELGYGDRGSPPKIGGGDVLVFTMEIMKIKGGKKPASKCDVGSLEGCTEKESKYVSSKRGLPGRARRRGEAAARDGGEADGRQAAVVAQQPRPPADEADRKGAGGDGALSFSTTYSTE